MRDLVCLIFKAIKISTLFHTMMLNFIFSLVFKYSNILYAALLDKQISYIHDNYHIVRHKVTYSHDLPLT